MWLWKSIVGKLWGTIIILVLFVLGMLGLFLLDYIDQNFANSSAVKHLFVYTCIIGFSLTTIFAFFLSTKITQPLVQLKNAAVQITRGDYKTRVSVRSSDEIGQLANAFNYMAIELEDTIRDLNHEKEQLSSILRSMGDAVITFDAEGKVILANPQGELILQDWNQIAWEENGSDLPAQEAQAPSLLDGSLPDPLRKLFSSVVEMQNEVTTKLHVQQEVWSVVLAPLYTEGAIRGAVAVLRDVTEEYRSDKLRKDFVANVSHELRTPISMLQGYSEALLDEIAATPEERRELVQVIHDESLRMGRLVKDLLDLARMEAGHMEMQWSRVNIAELARRVHRKFQGVAKDRGIGLQLDLAREELFVDAADEDRLEQVLTNLLDNGLRHTNEGASIHIRARYTTSSTSGEPRLLLEIEDEGRGIPAEDLPYVFERFYKADKARTRGNSGGTGLGLSIVKNIIDAHRGTVKVHSVFGQGTTFSITLPCRNGY
ncbi:histidine kinase [Paenibacillus swuensis]|uniref:histidine kinase n=1 Tax=Paenibacillus swuensis TaxID=1178515 RepID=A0A172TLU7_9BACL|nr:ATP-binding protein [Paenibacillus swuensis]ANE48000.1 histidine kinase [Paenibacillus swuensis]